MKMKSTRQQPTEEQKATAKLKRERFRELCKKVKALTPDQRLDMFKRMGNTLTCEGRRLSDHNTILLCFQREAVTVVGGFQQWRKLGRTVKKGEHGLMIWIPSQKNAPEGDTEVDTDSPNFFTGTVFDISQTDELTGHKQLSEGEQL